MSKTVYKIKLTNWNEHNPGKRKTHKKTLIANNLISDAKVLTLSHSQRWLFINLLLMAGDLASDTVSLAEVQLNSILGPGSGCERSLQRLESLQLVTFEKVESLITELKNNRRITEKNNKRRTIHSESEPSTQSANAVAVVEVEKVKIQISPDKQIEVKKDLINTWADTYPKDFLDLSLKEMRGWVLANPQKAPKSAWPRFINAWFMRGWERYRTTLKSNPVKITAEDLEAFLQEGA